MVSLFFDRRGSEFCERSILDKGQIDREKGEPQVAVVHLKWMEKIFGGCPDLGTHQLE